MSSTNEELPKPRVSPLEYRNTDLVSRLLAATPSYLYNMPLVPHSYFFSEMLRSFVQAKAQNQPGAVAGPGTGPTHKRSRKRVWSQLKTDTWQSKEHCYKPSEIKEDNTPWLAKYPQNIPEQKSPTSPEKPLELTINKLTNTANKITHKISDLEKSCETKCTAPHTQSPPDVPTIQATNASQIYANIPQQDANHQQQDLILPPPPPIWYPPIYPAPYGIDPLHFFIDLRVSGHIYDRKKETPILNNPQHHSPNFATVNATPPTSAPTNREFTASEMTNSLQLARESLFKQARHTSAFSVPTKNAPINLSNGKDEPKYNMGFGEYNGREDTKYVQQTENNVSTNYIMQNLQKIYNNILQDSVKDDKDDKCDINKENDNEQDEKGEKKQKGCKDLSALIGLELVVDYVKHEKPNERKGEDTQSNRSETPDLEIVENPNTF